MKFLCQTNERQTHYDERILEACLRELPSEKVGLRSKRGDRLIDLKKTTGPEGFFVLTEINTPNGRDKRADYIFNVLKLKRDPFRNRATAEDEVQEQPEDPPFYSNFVELEIEEGGETYLDLLLRESDVAVSGPQGSGKTTLRYNLAHKLRQQTTRTLAVSYEVRSRPMPTRRALPYGLTEALATDLFVQVIEQHSRLSREMVLNKLTPALVAYWQAHIPSFQRKLQRHVVRARQDAEQPFLRGWWEIWRRPIVRYTPRSETTLSYLSQLAIMSSPPIEPSGDTLQQFLAGVRLARRVGFQRLFLLVDEGETSDAATWREVVRRLGKLAARPDLALPIYLKLFLPDSVASKLDSLYSPPLRNEPISAIMSWNSPGAFRALLRKRFRSSGSKLAGFDVLAGRDITSGLDNWLIASAQQSPRRFVELASALIEVHAHRASRESVITLDDTVAVERFYLGHSSAPARPLTVD